MRKLLIIVGVLLFVGALVVTALLLSLNRIISGQQGRILQAAQAAIGRPVSVTKIAVNLWGGIGVRLQTVRVADDPRFGGEPFLQAASVTVHAKLWPLLHKQLEIGEVDLAQPEVRLIRDAAGRWNYASLKFLASQKSSHADVPPGFVPVRVVTASSRDSDNAAAHFLVSRLRVNDGTLVVIDRGKRPPTTTRLTHIDLTLHNLSTTRPISIELACALQESVQNVHLGGTVGPLAQRQAMPIDLQGSFGPWGPQKIRIQTIHLTATVTPDSVQVRQLNGQAFKGTFTLSGVYPLRSEGSAALKGKFSDIDVAQLLQIRMPDAPEHLAGSAQVALDLRSTGLALPKLTGTLTADIRDGALKDFNLVNEVLGRVTGLPRIGNLISANVKPKYGRLFTAKETEFKTLHGSFQIADQRMHTNDLAIIATDYGVRATGWLGFDRQVDLSGTLAMSKRFSDDVVADLKEAKYLLDASGQLAVPFRLRGKIGEAKPKPDTQYLVRALTEALKHGLASDLLQKFLGGKDRKEPTPAATPPANPLEQGLRRLFGR